ncbi:hypothetical protein TRAPUB_2103 [Trametes pubescens]|uniref:Uncharacterized protein n=1 Tax=Trametes pubescens TaxID=154538 RepID=A0A1M2VHL7_TRAPU|nr:hypothetical protein TRAPUB_2103 [Trametes pubescens]
MSSSDYEDSQPAQLAAEELASKPRPSRSSNPNVGDSALYEPGGALDSQTTDSQWASSFVQDALLSDDGVELVDASVQTDDPISLMELADTSTCCDEVEAANDLLIDELERLQEACAEVGKNNKELRADNDGLRDDFARMEALYEGVKGQLDSVRGMLAHDPVVLDPTEQSQFVMAMPPAHATPSRSHHGHPAPTARRKPSHSADGNADSRMTKKASKSAPDSVPKGRVRPRTSTSPRTFTSSRTSTSSKAKTSTVTKALTKPAPTPYSHAGPSTPGPSATSR